MRSPTVTWLDRPPVPAPSGDSLTDMATPRRRASSVPPLCGPSGIRGGRVELPVPARRPAVAGTGRERGDQLPALVPGPEPALGVDVAEGAEFEVRDVPGRGESPVGLRFAVEVVAAGEEQARYPERAGLQLAEPPGVGGEVRAVDVRRRHQHQAPEAAHRRGHVRGRQAAHAVRHHDGVRSQVGQVPLHGRHPIPRLRLVPGRRGETPVTRPGTSSHRVCQCPGPELWMPGTVSRCMRTPGAGGTASVPTVESDAVIPPVVPSEWLAAHRGSVVLADVRWYLDGRSGRAAYEEGHLPGAVFVDLDRWLAGPGSPQAGRHPLPAPEVFAQGMAEAGVGDDDVVVAYDDVGGVVAARLVWMLRETGHPAALLDGGLRAYDGPLEQAAVARAPAVFTPRSWPEERLAG